MLTTLICFNHHLSIFLCYGFGFFTTIVGRSDEDLSGCLGISPAQRACWDTRQDAFIYTIKSLIMHIMMYNIYIYIYHTCNYGWNILSIWIIHNNSRKMVFGWFLISPWDPVRKLGVPGRWDRPQWRRDTCRGCRKLVTPMYLKITGYYMWLMCG